MLNELREGSGDGKLFPHARREKISSSIELYGGWIVKDYPVEKSGGIPRLARLRSIPTSVATIAKLLIEVK